jgi:hypothetical protein
MGTQRVKTQAIKFKSGQGIANHLPIQFQRENKLMSIINNELDY